MSDRAADAAACVTEQGETVTYTAFGGSPVSVTAIWDPLESVPAAPDPSLSRGSINTAGVGEARSRIQRGTLQALPADIAAPDERDTFTISGSDYAVQEIVVREWLLEFLLVRMDQHRSGGTPALVET